MKKDKSVISPEEAVLFLDSFRKMMADQDEPTKAISIRIPGNILKALKTKAKIENKKYQSLIVEYLRLGLSERYTRDKEQQR